MRCFSVILAICLLWVGAKLDAPTWYNVLLYIVLSLQTTRLLLGIYNNGVKNGKKESS